MIVFVLKMLAIAVTMFAVALLIDYLFIRD